MIGTSYKALIGSVITHSREEGTRRVLFPLLAFTAVVLTVGFSLHDVVLTDILESLEHLNVHLVTVVQPIHVLRLPIYEARIEIEDGILYTKRVKKDIPLKKANEAIITDPMISRIVGISPHTI